MPSPATTPTSPNAAPASEAGARARAGAWQRFAAAYLYDYTPAAVRAWLATAAAGLAALGWALAALWAAPPQPLPAAASLALVTLAALLPIRVPRTTQTWLVADIFVITTMVTVGTPLAVLAAGLEALIGTLPAKARVSSRFTAPAVAMIAMVGYGHALPVAAALLHGTGLAPEVADWAAIFIVSPLAVLVISGPQMALAALKRGRRLLLADWWAAASGFGTMYMGSALAAGLLLLNAQRFGMGVIWVAGALTLSLALLLRTNMRRQERERRAQEALVVQAQHEAELNQQRFTAAFAHAAIGMAIARPDGCMLQVNQALCGLLRRDSAELLGRSFFELLPPGDVTLFRRRVDGVAERRESAFAMELPLRAVDGRPLWAALHCGGYDDPGVEGHCLIFQLHDITSRHVAESRLQHIAYHDGLTDLANRSCFQERLAVAVETSRLDPDERFAVLFLDLDRFKIVNDSLGHLAGNELLREVAQRLRGCVRPGDLVARLGGDEFAVLLEGLHDTDAGMRLAQRVLATLTQPMAINGTEVVPGASVGITFSDLGYRTVDEVLRDADLAMYEAKAAGRGRVALFDNSMHERVAEKLALEADLRRAIGEGQLTVQFQPLYHLSPHRLYGFEALARWVHPQRGPVSPAVFIALAEETGHIDALTDWVIEHSVAQLATWQRRSPQAVPLGMHVNISARDLDRPALVGHVAQVLHRHGLAPECLTLEITETTLMGRLDSVLPTMVRLRETGVRFSIDDFGTGYSSLAYLGKLPIDSLKIDRSFVMGLHEQPQNVEIVRAVLNLGESLNRKVIAEGVETAEQLATLRKLGVPIGQGYLLSRPLRAEQVDELLAITEPA